MLENILEKFVETPLIKIKKINALLGTNVVIKLEKYNSSGSIKDRAAKYIIDIAEKLGHLKPRGTIIESSSGNFAISLAMIGSIKGYNAIILVDPKATESNISVIESIDIGDYITPPSDMLGHAFQVVAKGETVEKALLSAYSAATSIVVVVNGDEG